jgi:hypothetical protein
MRTQRPNLVCLLPEFAGIAQRNYSALSTLDEMTREAHRMIVGAVCDRSSFLAPATSCIDGKNARSQTAPTVEQSDIVNHSYGWAE